MRWLPRLILLSAVFLASAPTVGAGAQVEPNLTDIWQTVFQPDCALCHSSDSGLGFQADTKLNAYNTLVNRPALFCDNETRVLPGNAAASYLVKKLTGVMACGDQMPLGDLPLDQDTLDAIRAWVDAGAVYETPVTLAPSTWSAIKTHYHEH